MAYNVAEDISIYDIDEVSTKPKDRQKILDKQAVALWKKCLEIIKDNTNAQTYKTWFEPVIPKRYAQNMLTVQVPSQFFCEWIEEHYYELLQKILKKVLGDNVRLQYEIAVEEGSDTLESRTIKLPAFKFPPSGRQNIIPFTKEKTIQDTFNSNLNSRYSFDNFITGESNQLARSAALAVSENPGKTRFNPLVIYGDTGLGKTHLAQAIGNHIIHKNGHSRVLYTNSEHFTMEFVNAIQNNKVNEFIGFYRSIDVLIVDDIQFFGGKEKTQDNFFHTFNSLHQAGKQLVLTSDKPPRDLKDVDDRLISRFQWGLTVDIQPPDLEMRMAILQRKSLDEGLELSVDIIEYIARNITSSIRELEGVLIGILAKVTFDRRDLSLELAKEVLYGIADREQHPLNIDEIKKTVAEYYKLPVEQLESKSRKHEIALARQMSMYLAKQLTQLSLKSIGAGFSGRDHSTVLHSCQTIENYFVTDKSVKEAYNVLLSRLKK